MEFKKSTEIENTIKDSYITILKERITLMKQSIVAIEDALQYLIENVAKESNKS